MSYNQRMAPSKKKIKEWLKMISKDRFWLAEQCRVEKVTIDKWLSSEREIPSKALLIIQQLMEESKKNGNKNIAKDQDVITSLDFSAEEMEVVRRFRKNFPGIDLETYLRNKVIELCAGLENHSRNQSDDTEEHNFRVAEDTEKYGTPIE